MSIFTEIASAEHTFVAWFEKEITALEKAAPTLEKDADAVFTYATTGLAIVASQLEAGSPAAVLVSKALADLKTASATVYDFGTSPTIGTFIQSIVSNLGGLEGLAGIKSATAVSTVGKVVSTLAALATAFLQIAPAVA